jgi:hypothetical protein
VSGKKDIMLTQTTVQSVAAHREECWIVADSLLTCQPNMEVDKTLSDIARRLTSSSRSDSLASSLISYLAKILGGGLRSVW